MVVNGRELGTLPACGTAIAVVAGLLAALLAELLAVLPAAALGAFSHAFSAALMQPPHATSGGRLAPVFPWQSPIPYKGQICLPTYGRPLSVLGGPSGFAVK